MRLQFGPGIGQSVFVQVFGVFHEGIVAEGATATL
jgi:hypothetical protein